MKKNILILILITLLLCGCGSSNKTTNNFKINGIEAKEKIKNGAILLDVRTKEEYDEHHIEGAILLSIDSMNSETVANVFPNKESVIIVYCRSGNRSASALTILRNLGYTNVYDLGSINNW